MLNAREQLIGNTFMHPALDYVLIGGGWSIIFCIYLLVQSGAPGITDSETLWVIILLANSTHFAASTIRLYSKPQYYQEFSFLAFSFPIITFIVLIFCVMFPDSGGRYLWMLMLTWAPFHYAKQIFGLSLMYTFRSGIKPDTGEKRLIYWVCLTPFLFYLVNRLPFYAAWLLTPEIANQISGLPTFSIWGSNILKIAVFVGPIYLFSRILKRKQQALPLMVPVMMVSNGLWWTMLDPLNAFAVATVAHAIQYLGIMLVYHVREQMRNADNRYGWLYHATNFYGRCLLLGYAMFYCLPYVFVMAGASYAQAMLPVAAAINIHHFVVDGYIWRLRVPANQQALSDSPLIKTT